MTCCASNRSHGLYMMLPRLRVVLCNYMCCVNLCVNAMQDATSHDV